MTTGIIPNQQAAWYDTAVQASDSVLISQMNYQGAGADYSALRTRVRWIQDMFRHTLPNQTRQGLGLGTDGSTVTIAKGDAVIAGRWAWTDTGDTVECTGLSGGGAEDYYLYWRVEDTVAYTDPSDSSSRNPLDETSRFYVALVSGYSNSSYEIVLGKVSIDNGIPTFVNETDKYTSIPDQIAVGRIVPRTRSADDQNSYSSVRIAYAAAGREVIDQISTESYGARIFNKLQLDDTTGSVDAMLKNAGGVIMARNDGATDDDYVPIDADSYRIDGVVVIDNSRQLDNVTIINSTLNEVTLAGNIISVSSRQIQMNNVADTTLTITNTDTGKAHLTIDGTFTGETALFSTPLGIASGGTGAATASLARDSLGLTIESDVQAYDAGLQSISGLVTSADKMIYTDALDNYVVIPLTSYARDLIDDTSFAAMRTTMGVQIGADVMQYGPSLNQLRLANNVTNRIPLMGGGNNWGYILSGTAGRAILADGAVNDVISYLNLEIGDDVQAYHDTLQEISAVNPSGSQLIMWSNSTTATVISSGTVGRDILNTSSQSTARSAIDAAQTSHVHNLGDIGADVIQYNASELYVYNDIYAPPSSFRYWGFELQIDNSGYLWLSLPYFKGKTVSNVSVRAKNKNPSNGRSLYLEIVAVRDVVFIAVKAGPEQVSLSPDAWGTMSLDWDGSTSVSNEHLMLRIRSNVDDNFIISTVTVDYV